MSYWQRQQQPQPEVVLGGIPLIRASHFRALGNEYWRGTEFCSWNAPPDLERLQNLLHEKGQEKDVSKYEYDSDDDEEEKRRINSIILEAKTKYSYRSWTDDNKIPFHEDILPRWEAFADNVLKNREGLQRIKIDNIVLPTAPFFENKLLPILNNNNDTLISLSLSSCGLGSDGINLLAKFIKKNKVLSVLDLSGNMIVDVGSAKSLALAIKKHPELCFLDLSKCNLGGTKIVGHSRGVPIVENIGGGERSVAALSALLTGCKGLTSLIIDDNGIDCEEGINVISKFLKNNKTLTEFSLGGNDIKGKIFDQAMQKNLELCQIRMTTAVPSFLKNNNANLISLDLSGDASNWERGNIRTPGAKIIAKYLKGNPGVTELNLSWNRLPSAAAKVLASAMKKNTNLEHLNLSYNSFSDKSVDGFVELLRNNSTLLSLNLTGNNIKVDKQSDKTGRAALLKNAILDTTSLQTIADSNHSCQVIMGDRKFRNDLTHEAEMKSINSLDSEGMKIRYKVVLALFSYNKDLFHPRSFDEVPLGLMPRLLELVQQEIGFNGFGKGVFDKVRKMKSTRELRRLYQVVSEWNTPLLVMRGPGKLKRKKRKAPRKRKRCFGDENADDDDEDYKPKGGRKAKK